MSFLWSCVPLGLALLACLAGGLIGLLVLALCMLAKDADADDDDYRGTGIGA